MGPGPRYLSPRPPRRTHWGLKHHTSDPRHHASIGRVWDRHPCALCTPGGGRGGGRVSAGRRGAQRPHTPTCPLTPCLRPDSEGDVLTLASQPRKTPDTAGGSNRQGGPHTPSVPAGQPNTHHWCVWNGFPEAERKWGRVPAAKYTRGRGASQALQPSSGYTWCRGGAAPSASCWTPKGFWTLPVLECRRRRTLHGGAVCTCVPVCTLGTVHGHIRVCVCPCIYTSGHVRVSMRACAHSPSVQRPGRALSRSVEPSVLHLPWAVVPLPLGCKAATWVPGVSWREGLPRPT